MTINVMKCYFYREVKAGDFDLSKGVFRLLRRILSSFLLWPCAFSIECEIPMRTFIVDQPGPLLETLIRVFRDTNRTRLKQSLKHGGVFVNDRPVTQFDFALKTGDTLKLGTKRPEDGVAGPDYDVRVVYEDEKVIVVDKPSGLLTIATDKIRDRTAMFAVNDFLNRRETARMRTRFSEEDEEPVRKKQIFVVHRLDRGASGLLVFAKDGETKDWLQEHWEEFSKTYNAVVEGCPEEKQGTVESYLTENKILRMISGPKTPHSKWAVTHYRVLKSDRDYSLLEVRLETGRKHQIRVHMADLGCPIAGDKDYGCRTNPAGRLALHACRLEIRHPKTGAPLVFESALPHELKKIVKA